MTLAAETERMQAIAKAVIPRVSTAASSPDLQGQRLARTAAGKGRHSVKAVRDRLRQADCRGSARARWQSLSGGRSQASARSWAIDVLSARHGPRGTFSRHPPSASARALAIQRRTCERIELSGVHSRATASAPQTSSAIPRCVRPAASPSDTFSSRFVPSPSPAVPAPSEGPCGPQRPRNREGAAPGAASGGRRAG